MLRDPAPGDWLMIRGNYKAWSYSPLTEINASNVKELQLAWSWAMNDGAGANEPTPIVHNGIMYLANTGNIVQALDAGTGDLIWENRLGPALSNGQGAIRSLAVYLDKVYLAATDVRLVALDARTGKVVWETRMADPSKGYGNTSGPLIIQGKMVQGMGRLRSLQRHWLLHQRLRRAERQAALEIRNRGARWNAGRRYLGQASEPAACRRRYVDYGQL